VNGVFLQWVPLHSMAIADYLSIIRTFQDVFPNATMWYTGGGHTLLLATPEPLTDAWLAERLENAPGNLVVQQELGDPEQVSGRSRPQTTGVNVRRYWIMNLEQLGEFAGQGGLVRDNDTFFLPIHAETERLIQIIQLAAVRANP
jgi:hypothetical protein